MYSSEGLNGWQVCDQDGLKGDYIRKNTPYGERIREKQLEGRERKNYCSINFDKQWSQYQSIYSDNYFLNPYLYFYACLLWRSLLAVISFVKNLAFSPTLYKFIVLGSLGLNPHRVGFGLKNSGPTTMKPKKWLKWHCNLKSDNNAPKT